MEVSEYQMQSIMEHTRAQAQADAAHTQIQLLMNKVSYFYDREVREAITNAYMETEKLTKVLEQKVHDKTLRKTMA